MNDMVKQFANAFMSNPRPQVEAMPQVEVEPSAPEPQVEVEAVANTQVEVETPEDIFEMRDNVYHGDCLAVLAQIPDNSIDAVVTDPPYGLSDHKMKDITECLMAWAQGKTYEVKQKSGFMGKSWDKWVPGPEVYKEVYRVLKPGGHALVFAGTRSVDLMSISLRLSGFELRDMLSWVYGCLSDDTEILTDEGWVGYDDPMTDRHALCYDAEADTFAFRPIQERFIYDHDDTAYRILSDHTDQLVTRNHRCLVERGGTFVFQFAEEAAREREARVPVLEGLRDLLESLSDGSMEEPASRYTRSDLARIEPVHYRGIVWCVRVPTGAFVARRNGKVFVTGNSGFPKGLNISKAIDKAAGKRKVVGSAKGAGSSNTESLGVFNQEYEQTAPATDEAEKWEGWGTALKPAYEPIIMVRKPVDKGMTIAENVLAHGVGGINIDGCRIPTDGEAFSVPQSNPGHRKGVVGTDIGITNSSVDDFQAAQRQSIERTQTLGRYPATLIHDGSDEVLAVFPQTSSGALNVANITSENGREGEATADKRYDDIGVTNFSMLPGQRRSDSGSAARFFYCAKASKAEREGGLDGFEIKLAGAMKGSQDGSLRKGIVTRANHHPTVKPRKLMEYLVRMITPPGGTVLDPFTGSGSTGVAAIAEGFEFIGIEQDDEYVEIARARIRNEHVRGIWA